jgi:hypothetical protein
MKLVGGARVAVGERGGKGRWAGGGEMGWKEERGGLWGKETGRAKQAGGLVRLPGPGRREGELGWAGNGEG